VAPTDDTSDIYEATLNPFGWRGFGGRIFLGAGLSFPGSITKRDLRRIRQLLEADYSVEVRAWDKATWDANKRQLMAELGYAADFIR
jgi:hypothetical protein